MPNPARRILAAQCRIVCLLAALALALPVVGTAQTNQPAPAPVPRPVLVARIDSLASSVVRDSQSAGISIAVIRGSDTLALKGYGMSDLENGVPVTSATVFRIGSVTKQFTSSAVMLLVQRGIVRIDDSIGTYLPSLPAAWRGIPVRDILNHTSGIPDYTNIGEPWIKRWGETMSPATIVALTANKPLDFAPGTKWKYDNGGYVVLGMLLEKMTGVPYATYVDSALFKPLGLTSTIYCNVVPIIPHRAQGYDRSGHTFTNSVYMDMSQPFAAGALCSTPGDLARWNRLLATGHVVSPSSYKEMTTPLGAAVARHYGFGLFRDTVGGKVMIEHSGGIPGFSADNAYLPEDSLSVTVLANTPTLATTTLLRNIVRATLGLPLIPPKLPPAPH